MPKYTWTEEGVKVDEQEFRWKEEATQEALLQYGERMAWLGDISLVLDAAMSSFVKGTAEYYDARRRLNDLAGEQTAARKDKQNHLMEVSKFFDPGGISLLVGDDIEKFISDAVVRRTT